MRLIKNERGAILVITLITAAVLLLLGTALIFTSTGDIFQATRQEDKIAAYYLARSGADAAASYLLNNPEELLEVISYGPDEASLGNGRFVVAVSEEDDETISIESTGYCGKLSETVILTLIRNKEGDPLLDMAVFSWTGIVLEGNSKIDRCGTMSTEEQSVIFAPNSAVTGDLYIGPGGDSDRVIQPYWSLDYHISGNVCNLEEIRRYPLPPFPVYPTLPPKGSFTLRGSTKGSITEDGQYDELVVRDNSKLTITVPDDGIRLIGARKFKAGGNSEIILQGGGLLYLYVEELVLSENARINDSGECDPNKIMLFCTGTKPVEPSDNTLFYGCLYAEKADIKLKGNGGILGSIITGGNQVTLDDNSTASVRTIYAPHAHVNMQGNSVVYGTVIANSFKAKDNSQVVYCQASWNEIPLPEPPDPAFPSLRIGQWKKN